MQTFARLALTCCTLSLLACGQRETTMALKTPEAVEPAQCGSVRNLHIAGDIYLAGQPAAEDFALLKQRGVKTVIDLRYDKERPNLDEAKIVHELGLTYAHLPWNGPDELTDQTLDAMRKLLRESERPVMLHCASANRVGAGWLAYRVLDQGVGLEDALAEAKTVGMRTVEYRDKVLRYIESNQ